MAVSLLQYSTTVVLITIIILLSTSQLLNNSLYIHILFISHYEVGIIYILQVTKSKVRDH